MPAKPQQLREALRRLADWPQTDLPVISAYLDLRPQATGNNPQVRSGQIVLRDRLREIERELEPRSAGHDSLVADVERIDQYIEEDALPTVQCLCLFACHGVNQRFETIHTSHPVDNEVSVGGRPRLLPLARLADTDAALVVLADTNTLRLFGLRSGTLEEVGLVDDEPTDYSQASGGGWSQARFQRHVEEHREAFAQLAAQAIDEVCANESAAVVVLAGDEVALPLVSDALPAHIAEKTHSGLRIDMRAPIEQVADEALPFLETLRAETAADAVDRLVGTARAGGLAVTGPAETRDALQLGQVAEVLLDPSAEFDEPLGEEIVRLAAATDARIRFADEHGGLRKLGGVGGLLRFQLDSPVSATQSDDQREGAAVSS